MRMSDWSSDVCSSDLARVRNHVVVAAEHERRAVVEQRLDTRLEPRHPAQFVRVLLGADGIAVRKEDRRNAKAPHGRFDITGVIASVLPGETFRDSLRRARRECGDTTAGPLAVDRPVVAEEQDVEASEKK